MKLRQCRGLPGRPCAVLTSARSGRCGLHETSASRAARNDLYADPRWHRLVAKILGSWRARWGWQCPGWRASPHMASRDNPLTVDHIIPVAARPDLAFEETNLQVLCRACNGRKGATVDPALVSRSR